MQVVDRLIRSTTPSATVPCGVVDAPTASLAEQIRRGTLDHCLGPLREIETAGPARESVLAAIDARSRAVR